MRELVLRRMPEKLLGWGLWRQKISFHQQMLVRLKKAKICLTYPIKLRPVPTLGFTVKKKVIGVI
ncbi:hypothetical protein CCT19_15390 [Escherichia coli]|nr:hypothetical protein [Escherichia coli]EGD4804741.1 hypothetical protein [Escherichia coli]EGD4994932.1 hypothetical protein [Escherichia coli]PHU81460.1 hypothetical protein CSW70_01110 [Shigella sonnei]